MSDGFQPVDWANLEWPAYYRIDHVRVYQRGDGSVGCDPEDHPTSAFIARHSEAYTNPNLTTWEATGETRNALPLCFVTAADPVGNSWPKNKFKDGC